MDGGDGGSGSLLSSIGSEIISIISPVSICMFLVVLLISLLTSPSSPPSSLSQIRTAANLVYLETPSDTSLTKLEGSLLNAVVFILIISLVTFLLYLLYYYNFTNFLKHYTRFSAFFVLSSLGGSIFLSLIIKFSPPLDVVTCFFILFNFSVTGVVSVFGKGFPILIKQFYSVILGVIVAAWFTQLPEWTTWCLLVALALYDLVAVLAPGGPLRVLVELASSREEEIPALIYEARPNVRVAREGGSNRLGDLGVLVAGSDGRDRAVELQNVGRGRGRGGNEEEEHVVSVDEIEVTRNSDDGGDRGETWPLMALDVREQRERSVDRLDGDGDNSRGGGERVEEGVSLMQLMNGNGGNGGNGGGGRDEDDDDDDDDDNGLMPGIKLGLGDFIFYSVLVGRAAMYDLMTVYACYLAIIAGLGCTLILLAVCRKALPALPISIALGVIFYFLTRLLMEPFVVGTATNLMMF